jgi:Icc protein
MGYNFGMKLSRYHIAWISDIHIGSADQQPNGVDVRGNFTRALEDICRFDVDMLVLGGDLCLDSGERDAYLWISRELDRLNPARRIVVLPGNHDDPEMMAQIRNPVDLGGGLPRVEILDPEGITPAAGIRTLFLDSSSRRIGNDQTTWLEKELAQSSIQGSPGPEIAPSPKSSETKARPRLVFVHHPPLPSGVPYMDENYPLEDWPQVAAALSTCPDPVWVFCGHYHCDVQTTRGNVTVFASPSTYTPINPMENRHQADTMPPGWRLIRIDGNGVHSYPRYII